MVVKEEKEGASKREERREKEQLVPEGGSHSCRTHACCCRTRLPVLASLPQSRRGVAVASLSSPTAVLLQMILQNNAGISGGRSD